MKKVVGIINSDIYNPHNTTFKGIVDTCVKYGDAKFIDSNGTNYDFKNNQARILEYENGKLVDKGFREIDSDLVFFYSDGYKTDTKKLGYAKPTEYHEELMSFLERQVSSGNVGQIVNSPAAERTTLKKYFAELNPEEFNIIPTYLFDNFDDLYVKFKEKGKLVVKPDWGGSSMGVDLLKNEKDLMSYKNQDLDGLVFQDYYPGDEKRMWIVGGKFVDGRIVNNRNPPWMKKEGNSHIEYYNSHTALQKDTWFNLDNFNRDKEAVEKITKKTDLKIGSVDFLGDKINELNGAGTGFVFKDRYRTKVIDARQHLFNYLESLLRE